MGAGNRVSCVTDIHTHFVPPEFAARARTGRALDDVTMDRRGGTEWMRHRQGYVYPLTPEFYDVSAKLQQMDRLGVDMSVLSLSPTLFFYWLEAAAADEFCIEANDSLAAFVAQSDRLQGLASVPLQDPARAAAELRRAVVELGLRGVEVGTTMETVPLDDPRFEPVFSTAEELNVPVMLHPYYVGVRPQLADFYMTNLTGNPLETCIAATRMILSGFLDRHPRLKVVLVHAGGFMPYQAGRLDRGFQVRTETNAAIGRLPSTYLRRFWYDTITHAAAPLKFLIELVGVDRVALGTDLPFDMADIRFETTLSSIGLDRDALERVTFDTAAHLFGLEAVSRA